MKLQLKNSFTFTLRRDPSRLLLYHWSGLFFFCPLLEGVKMEVLPQPCFKKMAGINFIQISSSIKLAAFFRPAAPLV
jgi:hypothetical protein